MTESIAAEHAGKGGLAAPTADGERRKCNDEVTAWLRRKQFDERDFLRRFVEINRALVEDGMP